MHFCVVFEEVLFTNADVRRRHTFFIWKYRCKLCNHLAEPKTHCCLIHAMRWVMEMLFNQRRPFAGIWRLCSLIQTYDRDMQMWSINATKVDGRNMETMLTTSLPQPLKFPGWKMHGRACALYIFRSFNTSAFSATLFDENPFTCQCEKKKKRKEKS